MSYTGNAPAEQYITTVKDTFNGDNSTTDFTLSRPALANNLEVFVENVQQEPTTAYTVSGTTISFTSAPVSGTGNIYVIHRGQAVQTIVPPAGISLNATDASITNGLTVDKDGATVATFDRATSDGDIVEFQKGGSTVGSIGTKGDDLTIGSGDAGLRMQADIDAIYPFNVSTNLNADNTTDLGTSVVRFKDLYLSGGVVFGSTGGSVTSKTLDDYEEGSWTPVWTDSGGGTYTGTLGEITGRYTKVGRICYFYFVAQAQQSLTSNGLTGGNQVYIDGLPFTKVNAEPQAVGYAEMYADIPTGATQHGFFIRNNVDYVAFRYSGDDFSANNTTVDHIENGASRTIQVSGFFEVA